MALEKLGWHQYKGEIKRKPSIQVGTVYIQPDLVLYDNANNPAVVVEVKRPNSDLVNSQSIGQLTSYMLRLKAGLSLLVGNEIHVYYDGKLNPEHDPIMVANIPFNRKGEDGHILMGILDRKNFMELKSDVYLKQWIDKYKMEMKLVELTQLLNSGSTKQKIIDFLKTEFAAYGIDVINNVFNKVEITINTAEVKEQIEPFRKKIQATIKPEPVRELSYVNNKLYTLEELINMMLLSSKPEKLQIGEQDIRVNSWRELCVYFVRWLIEKGYLTRDKVPVMNAAQRDKYFINKEAKHKNPERHGSWHKVGDYFIDSQYSAPKHVENLIHTLEHLGIKDPGILISLRS